MFPNKKLNYARIVFLNSKQVRVTLCKVFRNWGGHSARYSAIGWRFCMVFCKWRKILQGIPQCKVFRNWENILRGIPQPVETFGRGILQLKETFCKVFWNWWNICKVLLNWEKHFARYSATGGNILQGILQLWGPFCKVFCNWGGTFCIIVCKWRKILQGIPQMLETFCKVFCNWGKHSARYSPNVGNILQGILQLGKKFCKVFRKCWKHSARYSATGENILQGILQIGETFCKEFVFHVYSRRSSTVWNKSKSLNLNNVYIFTVLRKKTLVKLSLHHGPNCLSFFLQEDKRIIWRICYSDRRQREEKGNSFFGFLQTKRIV